MSIRVYIREILNESLKSVINEVDWEDKFGDVKKKCVPPDVLVDELNAEIKRISVPKKDREKRRLDQPIYTKGNIEKTMNDEGKVDPMKFKELITQPPKTIFDQNPKMEKSDKGGLQLTVNTGIPAILGIIWDEKSKKFYKINTCPGAGECKLVCYARKGFYGMNDGKSMKLLRRLNLLLNNPDEYYNMIMDELEPLALKVKRQGRREGRDIELVIRWNDAGDFFTKAYYDIAARVTKKLINDGYPVRSYTYTKLGDYMELSSSDFLMNFSRGANKREMDKVDIEKVKQSVIVPRKIFSDLFVKKGLKYVKGEDGLPQFVEGGAEKLKKRISLNYNVPMDNLLFLHELPEQQGEPLQYNAIVLPTGDSDISAQREDVKITFLLIH